MSSKSDPPIGFVSVTLDTDMHTTGKGFPRGLYVGSAGNVAFVFEDGTEATLPAMAAGITHPVRFRQIKTSGTSASSLFAAY